MKSVTVDEVMAWQPCPHYSGARVKQLFAGRERLTAEDIAALKIPAPDRFWALLHHEFLTDEQMHLLACNIAEDVLPIFEQEYPNDDRPRRAIEAKRAWLRGEISDDDLDAIRNAAYAAQVIARGTAWNTAIAIASSAVIDSTVIGGANEVAWATAREVATCMAWDAWEARHAAEPGIRAAAWKAAQVTAWEKALKLALAAIAEEGQ